MITVVAVHVLIEVNFVSYFVGAGYAKPLARPRSAFHGDGIHLHDEMRPRWNSCRINVDSRALLVTNFDPMVY